MPPKLQNFWEGCYEGHHRQKSPEEFKKQFCDRCMNVECTNSRGTGTAWSQRMSTQEDVLLRNPRFADKNDPRFRDLSGMNFQNMLQQALAIEISTKRGDWSVPTSQEIGHAAAELAGLTSPSRPSKFQEPEEDRDFPRPPERLVDEVLTYDQKFEDRVVSLPEGKWKIRGDSGKIYEVTLSGEGVWSCTCPSRQVPCKHALSIEKKLSRSPDPSPPVVRPPPTPPPKREVAEKAPKTFAPTSINTTLPPEGLMVGGRPPTPTPTSPLDPWAPTPNLPGVKERVIAVGGKVQFGKKK